MLCNVCMYVMYVCMYVCMYEMYVCIYACMYVCMYVQGLYQPLLVSPDGFGDSVDIRNIVSFCRHLGDSVNF